MFTIKVSLGKAQLGDHIAKKSSSMAGSQAEYCNTFWTYSFYKY